MLDIFGDAYTAAAAPQANEGTVLPASFGETFADAWSNGQLATSGIKQQNARTQAIQEYTDQINKASGGAVDAEYSKQLAEGAGITTVDAAGGGPDPLDVANGVVARLKASADAAGKPLPFQPMSSDDIDNRAAQISAQAMTAHAAMGALPQSLSSWLGKTAGAIASASVDPFNIPLLAIAPEGVIASAAAFGAGSALTQTANEAANSAFNEKVQPGYAASGQAFRNIAEAGVSGAEMGGGGALGVKALGAVLTRAVTGAWPTAAKDAANGVMSEADILNSNVLPGAEGEAAHQGALGTSIGQVLRGDPVDVSRDIPPDSAFERTIGDIPTEPREAPEKIGNGTAESYLPDTARFFESPKEGEGVSEAPAQLTPNAADVAADARFVDIPTDHPEISGENAPGLDAASGNYRPFEPSEDLASQLRPIESPATAAAEPSEAAADVYRPGSLTADQIREQLAAPETLAAMRADVERAIDESAKGGKALQVPLGFDFEKDADGHPIMSGMFGNQTTMTPVFGRVADALAEVDRMNELADAIAQCALPGAMQEAAE
jgi:hypothetical protein